MSGTRPYKVRNPYAEFGSDSSTPQKLGLKGSISVGAESSDVIAVTLGLEDSEGNSVSQSWTAEVRVLDGNGDATNPGTAFEIDVTTGTGVTAGTQDSMIITSNAAGAIVVDLTDVAGASGATVYLVAQPLNVNVAPIYSAVTFD